MIASILNLFASTSTRLIRKSLIKRPYEWAYREIPNDTVTLTGGETMTVDIVVVSHMSGIFGVTKLSFKESGREVATILNGSQLPPVLSRLNSYVLVDSINRYMALPADPENVTGIEAQ